VNLLIKDAGLEREVVPGTAHTLKGSEAPVVIFDLVLDEPHRQAGLFDPKETKKPCAYSTWRSPVHGDA
jgi:hypothetical protein